MASQLEIVRLDHLPSDPRLNVHMGLPNSGLSSNLAQALLGLAGSLKWMALPQHQSLDHFFALSLSSGEKSAKRGLKNGW